MSGKSLCSRKVELSSYEDLADQLANAFLLDGIGDRPEKADTHRLDPGPPCEASRATSPASSRAPRPRPLAGSGGAKSCHGQCDAADAWCEGPTPAMR
jgi:hypothetical protein